MEAIALDVGNSSIKVGYFVNSVLKNKWVKKNLEDVEALLSNFPTQKKIACSVGMSNESILKTFINHELIIVDHKTSMPIQNKYATPKTLGIDRLVAAVGAFSLDYQCPLLIIDIGTCITYDILDLDGSYLGGSISPGVELRFKSMNDYTKNLPLITGHQETNLIGKTTKEAMISGVMHGISAEIEGIIMQYQANFLDLKVIVCGGGLNSFEYKIKASIFAAPDLVLVGLNRILEHNDKNI